jgi:DNA-binding MarR family transcriptional regulator
MNSLKSESGPGDGRAPANLGPALRRAWIGYQQRLDEAMAAVGFGDRPFPDGRVLRMCRDSPGTTISGISRELGITRQGASKIVSSLRERGYVTVDPSPVSGREKTVVVTPKALDYLAARREAVRAIDDLLRSELGPDTLAHAYRLLEALGGGEDRRLRDYLREKGVPDV